MNGSRGSQVGRSEVKGAPWRSCDRAACRTASTLEGANRRHSPNGFSKSELISSCSSEERALHARQRNPAIPPPLPPPRKQNQADFPPTCNFYLFLFTTATLRAIFPATLSNHLIYQPMSRMSGSISRVSIPRDERSFLHLSRKEQSLPLRRHERNLRSRTFRFPLEAVFRRHGKRRAA